MIHKIMEHLQSGTVPLPGAVNGDLGVHALRLTHGALKEQAFGVLFHGPYGIAYYCGGGAVCLYTALISAGTLFSAAYQQRMAQLTAVAKAAVKHPAAQYKAATHSSTQSKQHGGPAAHEGSLVKLRKGRTVSVVREEYRDIAELLLYPGLQWLVVKIQVICVYDDAARRIYAARNDHAHAIQII